MKAECRCVMGKQVSVTSRTAPPPVYSKSQAERCQIGECAVKQDSLHPSGTDWKRSHVCSMISSVRLLSRPLLINLKNQHHPIILSAPIPALSSTKYLLHCTLLLLERPLRKLLEHTAAAVPAVDSLEV